MAKHKPDVLQRLLSGLSFRGILLHPATLFMLASIALIGGAIQLWNSHQEMIVAGEDYRLTAEKIQLTAQPDWSELDLKQLVLENASDDSGESASLLDTSLVARTVEKFKTVGWVERVRRVEKSRAGLEIDLVYRGAVGMVELNHMTIPDWPKQQAGQLLPVDRMGVIMPGRLVAEQPMLRFSVFNPIRFTHLDNWTEWPDERVKNCAEISELIGSRWQELGLYRIVTFRRPEQPDDTSVPFELWPDIGTQVIWGNPPGQELPNEASAEEKLQALELFVSKYGPLDQLAKAKIDIRSGKPISSDKFQTAELESLNSSRK